MKRVWTIQVPGYSPFSMVLMDGPQDKAGAELEARLIWPVAEVE